MPLVDCAGAAALYRSTASARGRGLLVLVGLAIATGLWQHWMMALRPLIHGVELPIGRSLSVLIRDARHLQRYWRPRAPSISPWDRCAVRHLRTRRQKQIADCKRLTICVQCGCLVLGEITGGVAPSVAFGRTQQRRPSLLRNQEASLLRRSPLRRS